MAERHERHHWHYWPARQRWGCIRNKCVRGVCPGCDVEVTPREIAIALDYEPAKLAEVPHEVLDRIVREREAADA